MNNHSPFRLTIEAALYLALACVALAARLWGLGAQPLSDAEAHDALLAFRFLQGEAAPAPAAPEPAPVPTSPLLFSLTAMSFLLFGVSDATARLAPALAGTALVFTPALFRRHLGRVPALLAAALLTLSPTLVAASRTADAAALLALAVLAALGCLAEYGWTGQRRYLFAAAASAGAALACGPRAVTAVLILGLGLGLWRLLSGPGLAAWVARLRGASESRMPAGLLLLLGVGVFVAGSSALLLYRPGLAAAAQALPAWLAGWQPAEGGRGGLHLPLILLLYEPLTLLLGGCGLAALMWRWGEKDPLAWALAAWSLAALAVGLTYPARASVDVVWLVIPLAGLAGRFAVDLTSGDWNELDAPAVAIHGGLVLLLLAYAGLNMAAYSLAVRTLSGAAAANLGLAAVSLVLVVLISLLFGVGWSAAGAVRGLALGLTAACLCAGLSAQARLVHWGEGPEMAAEVWHAGPPVPLSGLRLMRGTLERTSNHAVGAPHDLRVVVHGSRTGALAWAVRDFGSAVFVDSLGAAVTAPAVIAPADQATPELGSAYVGQAFAIRGTLDLAAWDVQDWLAWLAHRPNPAVSERVVLWVRSDVQFRTGSALGG